MRLWSLHPSYLDAKGLTALWREGLLARHVLLGLTRGYVNHPQLIRFKNQNTPIEVIDAYLFEVWKESQKRDYHYQLKKIIPEEITGLIPVQRGQLLHEWEHLKKKLIHRCPEYYNKIKHVQKPRLHPLFFLIEGGVESWEKV